MRYTICYVSKATAELKEEKIAGLLQKIEDANNRNNVKGILLYASGNFFHVMEGDKDYILELFTQIENDKRHTDIIQIVEKERETPTFDGFITDVVTEDNKYDPAIFKEYQEPLEGLEPQTKEVVKRMLRIFIATSE